MWCRGMTLKADAAREETEETLGMIENRLDQAEHSIQLLQYAVHQHDERIAGLTYSPARNSVSVCHYYCACALLRVVSASDVLHTLPCGSLLFNYGDSGLSGLQFLLSVVCTADMLIVLMAWMCFRREAMH